jgi:hypothetical protein
MSVKRQSLAQLFRDLHKVEAQVALLRLDLQAAGILSKTKIEITTEPGTKCTCKPTPPLHSLDCAIFDGKNPPGYPAALL